MKVLFYPTFESEDNLKDHMYRAIWYLYPLQSKIASLDIYASFIVPNEYGPHELLDPAIVDRRHVFPALRIHERSNLSDGDLVDYDFIFLHDDQHRQQLQRKLEGTKVKPRIVRVDHERVQYSDSFYLRFAENFPDLQELFVNEAKQLLKKYLEPLKTRRVYLFGTGPNFKLTNSCDFSDGVVIACNSMAINQDVIDRLKPKVFVIADPIFHAGPSCYASEFRQALIQSLRQQECTLLVPLRDYHIYQSVLPRDLILRTIPIKFVPPAKGERWSPVLDIISTGSVTATSNVLTLLQLPVAASLGGEIYISGCDGRSRSQASYFWKHDKTIQLNDKMKTIREAHPAFFNISFNDYYDKHEETLSIWLDAIEGSGKIVINLTPSFLRPLQQRTAPSLLDAIRRQRPTVGVTIIIPVFNAAKYIEETLYSILNEGMLSFEIIVVDDFSDDATLDIVLEFSKHCPQLLVIQNFGKKGVSGARNSGVRLANGKYFAFLDADDPLPRGSLSARIQYLENHPETLIVHSHLRFIDENGVDLGLDVGTKRKITFQDVSGNPASFNTLVFRRCVAQKLSFDEDLTNGEDWLALARILRMGYVSEYIEAGFGTYRVHPNSTVVSDMIGHEVKLKKVIEWIYEDVSEEIFPESLRCGLRSPSKLEILISRRLNTLIWKIFSGDDVDVASFLERDLELISFCRKPSSYFEKRVLVGAIRAFGKPAEKLKELPLDQRFNIIKSLMVVTKTLGNIGLVDAISNIFSLRIESLSAAHGNFSREAERGGYSLLFDKNFTKIHDTIWHYSHVSINTSRWLAVCKDLRPSAGQTYSGSLTLCVDRDMTVIFSLNRHGDTQFEGKSIRLRLKAGIAQSVRLTKRFDKPHSALRLQVEVYELPGGGTADLTIKNFCILETLVSFLNHLREDNINFGIANQHFRNGEYRHSLGIYLLLNQRQPMRIYAENALFAARRLKMTWIKSAEELQQLLV